MLHPLGSRHELDLGRRVLSPFLAGGPGRIVKKRDRSAQTEPSHWAPPLSRWVAWDGRAGAAWAGSANSRTAAQARTAVMRHRVLISSSYGSRPGHHRLGRPR